MIVLYVTFANIVSPIYGFSSNSVDRVICRAEAFHFDDIQLTILSSIGCVFDGLKDSSARTPV